MFEEIPQEPGTVPIPDNHIRLYHYTKEPGVVDKIRQEGLKNEYGVGETYGEPSQIWASTQRPNNYKEYVEFHMPVDDRRIDIGRYQPGINYGTSEAPDYSVEAAARMRNGGNYDLTIPYGDVQPNEIIAAHKPWHHSYRYLTEDSNLIQNVLDGEYDWADEERYPNEYQAIQYIKHHSKHSHVYNTTHYRQSDVSWGGDAYPAEQPDHEQMRRDYTDTMKMYPEPEQRMWSLVNGELKVGHDEQDPQATGTMQIHNNWYVDFLVQSSQVAIKMLAKVLKAYARENGWKLHQIQDAVGNPIPWKKEADYPGIGDRFPGVKDWMQKEWSQESLKGDYYGFEESPDDNGLDLSDKPVKCPRCGQQFKNDSDWFLHNLKMHDTGDSEPEPRGPQNVVNMDDQLPAGFDEASRGWGKEPGVNTGSVRQSINWMVDDVGDAMENWADGYHGDDAIRLPFVYRNDADHMEVVWVGDPAGFHDWNRVPGGINSIEDYNDGEIIFSNFQEPIVHLREEYARLPTRPLSDFPGLGMIAKRKMIALRRAIKNGEEFVPWRGNENATESLAWSETMRQPGWFDSMRLSLHNNSEEAANTWADYYDGDDAIRIPFYYRGLPEDQDIELIWMGNPGSFHGESTRDYGYDYPAGEVVFSNFQEPVVHFDMYDETKYTLKDFPGISMRAVRKMIELKKTLKQGFTPEIWRGNGDMYGAQSWEDRIRTPGWIDSMKLSAEQIVGPIPWIYDANTGRIYVGHPGDPADSVYQYVAGANSMNTVEGQYLPSGELVISETTNLPVTVRYLIQLWYYMHPELEVKRVTMNYIDMAGKPRKERLAAEDVIHSKVNQILASDPAALRASLALMKYGNVYIVGGAIRDIALGKTPKDVDLMVQGIKENQLDRILQGLPGRVDLTGKNFGVYRYRDPEGNEVEIALPRTERSTGPGHKDFEVVTDPHIKVDEDLVRRDFTANAMAYDTNRSNLIDPHGGWNDIQNGVLRTVTKNSFRDDPLRILRGLAMHSKHGLIPDEQTRAEMRKYGPNLAHLPAERVQEELDKLMKGRNPASAFRLAQEVDALKHFLPEVAKMHGFDQQNKYHNQNLFDHTMSVLNHLTENTDDQDLRYMGLLHDIGKPESQWIDDDGWAHYYENEHGQGKDHETHGAQMAEGAMRRLKFPAARIDRVRHLVQNHMFAPFNTQKGARRFLNTVGDQHADDLLHMRAADLAGKDHRLDDVSDMRGMVADVRQQGQAFNKANLAITGKDLIAIGVKPGPGMGQLFNKLVELVIDNPSINTRDKLLQIAYELNGNG